VNEMVNEDEKKEKIDEAIKELQELAETVSIYLQIAICFRFGTIKVSTNGKKHKNYLLVEKVASQCDYLFNIKNPREADEKMFKDLWDKWRVSITENASFLERRRDGGFREKVFEIIKSLPIVFKVTRVAGQLEDDVKEIMKTNNSWYVVRGCLREVVTRTRAEHNFVELFMKSQLGEAMLDKETNKLRRNKNSAASLEIKKAFLRDYGISMGFLEEELERAKNWPLEVNSGEQDSSNSIELEDPVNSAEQASQAGTNHELQGQTSNQDNDLSMQSQEMQIESNGEIEEEKACNRFSNEESLFLPANNAMNNLTLGPESLFQQQETLQNFHSVQLQDQIPRTPQAQEEHQIEFRTIEELGSVNDYQKVEHEFPYHELSYEQKKMLKDIFEDGQMHYGEDYSLTKMPSERFDDLLNGANGFNVSAFNERNESEA